MLGDGVRARQLPGPELELQDLPYEDELTCCGNGTRAGGRAGQGHEVIVDSEPGSPRLHLAMHQITRSSCSPTIASDMAHRATACRPRL
jgi:hypothetical protein